MSLEIVLPMGNKGDVKDLVFTILTKEYPLKLIQLTNFIRKRYGKSVTFQAVRKAVLQLVSENILLHTKHGFFINKEWVKETKQTIDRLYEDINQEKVKTSSESIEGKISVFTFNSLNKMMKFWQDIISKWYADFRKGSPRINCYQAAHVWEGLLHLDRERELMGKLKKKGIVSYILSTGNTVLDKNIQKFYKKIGIKMVVNPSSSSFDKSYYVGTYGELVVQTQYPNEIVKELDLFFKKNRNLTNLDLSELSEIVNKKREVKLTVIKNLAMAKQINNSILSEIK
ncbi:hypothetical protein FJZ19_00630 [Candidatus Pacearchaeota archaeon]|nr:hypothetical protein [Candidatus Pacearchaeota archaeon]